MQQQFRANESANNTESRYDSEAVRTVLGRAAEIEAQTEPEVEAPLTAAQVEALGVELGLTPDAVRRALGELHPETRTAVRVGSMPPLALMVSIALPGLIYAALLTTLIYILKSKIAALLPPDWLGIVLWLGVLIIPSLLSLWMGWQRGNRTLASATGLFLTFFAGVAPLLWIERGYGMTELFLLSLSLVAGVLLGGIGAMLRERWEREQAATGR